MEAKIKIFGGTCLLVFFPLFSPTLVSGKWQTFFFSLHDSSSVYHSDGWAAGEGQTSPPHHGITLWLPSSRIQFLTYWRKNKVIWKSLNAIMYLAGLLSWHIILFCSSETNDYFTIPWFGTSKNYQSLLCMNKITGRCVVTLGIWGSLRESSWDMLDPFLLSVAFLFQQYSWYFTS